MRRPLVALLAVSIALVAAGRADAAPHRFDVGVVMSPWDASAWSKRVGAKPTMVAMYDSFGKRTRLAPFLRHTESLGIRRFFITLQSWKYVPVGQPSAAVQPRYTNARVAAGAFDSYLAAYARTLSSFRGEVYVRYDHEMNGNWYPWSFDERGASSRAGDYVRAWRRVYRILHRHARNVVMVWSPNAPAADTSLSRWRADLRGFYPGPSYVDAVGLTTITFNVGDEQATIEPEGKAGAYSPLLAAMRRWYRRPVWLTEANSNYGVRATWMRGLFRYVKRTPWVAGVVISQAPSHGLPGQMDWDISADRDLAAPLRSFIESARGLSGTGGQDG